MTISEPGHCGQHIFCEINQPLLDYRYQRCFTVAYRIQLARISGIRPCIRDINSGQGRDTGHPVPFLEKGLLRVRGTFEISPPSCGPAENCLARTASGLDLKRNIN